MEKKCNVFKCLCSEVRYIIKGFDIVCDCDCSNCEEADQYSDKEED
ncbi:MAG: hypothetical protein ABRQ25_12130 [Clostridiaceae bacterium]